MQHHPREMWHVYTTDSAMRTSKKNWLKQLAVFEIRAMECWASIDILWKMATEYGDVGTVKWWVMTVKGDPATANQNDPNIKSRSSPWNDAGKRDDCHMLGLRGRSSYINLEERQYCKLRPLCDNFSLTQRNQANSSAWQCSPTLVSTNRDCIAASQVWWHLTAPTLEPRSGSVWLLPFPTA